MLACCVLCAVGWSATSSVAGHARALRACWVLCDVAGATRVVGGGCGSARSMLRAVLRGRRGSGTAAQAGAGILSVADAFVADAFVADAFVAEVPNFRFLVGARRCGQFKCKERRLCLLSSLQFAV
eukprot:jgi/Ulvmu1/12624/UM093_0017.1